MEESKLLHGQLVYFAFVRKDDYTQIGQYWEVIGYHSFGDERFEP